ncbi:amidohydrolase family protein [Sediminicoccus sp. KRV36]|uniref:amidohydrolase family protein n=1 Tax=Sediminicoccus sp. KRV36 TaxID=3133721 RepID=UPI00200FAB9A|nr:amidohydrolase family protein [Sediminicoccus rosea]UPY35440.1 amidohydrolase family protein [Sediminicoccus rosea]
MELTFTCAPAHAVTNPPRQRAPEGSCDSHFHIFGPYDRFPLSATRPYTPPPALIAHYLDMARTLGLTRRVVVQASVYGTDNAVTMDAVAQFGHDNARAIVVVDDAATGAELRRLADAGAVGVRFNAVSGNGTPVEQLESLARRVADLGWHIQLYMKGDVLMALAPRLATLPVPLVLDHMAGVNAAHGPDGAALSAALRLIEAGRAHVKLCGYRASVAPYADLTPIARRFVAAAPERCVWGTDWPHTQFQTPAQMLDDGMLLDWLSEWVPDAATRRRILVENPAALYGF